MAACHVESRRTLAGGGAVTRLDPRIDVVFKLLLVRNEELLTDMLECTLGRPVGKPTILDPTIPGERVRDKRSILDLRVSLPGGSRVDLEMQARRTPALESRFLCYAARDYGDQLRRGEGYERLTPTTSILWMVEPLFSTIGTLHTVFDIRDPLTNTVFSDHLSIHLLQLSNVSPQLWLPHVQVNDYATQVERWARFLSAPGDAELDRLASENHVMSLATQALDHLSLDPEAQRIASERAAEGWFYRMTLAASRAEGRDEGRAEGEAKGRAETLLKLLGLRFGPLSAVTRARVEAGSRAQLEVWVERVLTAATLDDVFAW